MRRAKDKTGVVRGGILGTGGVGNAWPLAGPMSGRAVWGQAMRAAPGLDAMSWRGRIIRSRRTSERPSPAQPGA